MPQLQGALPDFAGLFNDARIARMLAELNAHEFEHFVGYVFEQAGYVVEDTAGHRGSGLDLRLYIGAIAPENLRAGVQIKHYGPDTMVVAPDVVKLRGGVADNGGVPGYLVTTNTFVAPALAQMNGTPRIWPIDGAHFLRYINYVRGTRTVINDDPDPDPWLHGNPLAPTPPEVFFTADTISRRPSQTTKVLTVANNKGGVGKTTTALNIAFGLTAQDQQVLLIDLDAQANLTRALPPPASNGSSLHIGDYFTHKSPLGALIRPTQFKRVWLIPASNDLNRADPGAAAGPGVEVRFERDVHATDIVPPPILDTRPFDWIILDTGPHMGLFTRSALAASHGVLAPVSPSAFADDGTHLLVTTVETVKALTGKPLDILGFLVTQWRDDATNRDLLTKFTTRVEPIGLRLFKTKVPYDKPNIERAHLDTGKGQKKNLLDRRAAVAQAYLSVVEEVLHYEFP